MICRVLMLLASAGLLLASTCAPEDGGSYCDGPASLQMTIPDRTSGQPIELSDQGDCRPGSWALSGDNLVAVVEPILFRPTPLYSLIPSIFGTTDTVVVASNTNGSWAGELVLPHYHTGAGAVQRLQITSVSMDAAENPTRLTVAASSSTDSTAVVLTINAAPSSDYDALLANANQRLAALTSTP